MRVFLICLSLIIITTVAYWQVGTHEFTNFDDDDYVTQNYFVKKGLSFENVKWAFSFTKSSYWHPVTWLSHMLDYDLFKLNAGRHHLMNLFFHVFNVLLLFLILFKMTSSPFKSAFVALLFALHPINVDSVAWIAERKNLLSTFFGFLTMLMYFYYSKQPNIYRYFLVISIFIISLLSKPMLVTLPFIFLLFDYWPLKRIRIEEIEVHRSKLRGIKKSSDSPPSPVSSPTKGEGKKGTSQIATKNRLIEEKKSKKNIQKKLSLQGTPVLTLIQEKIPFIILSLTTIYLSSQSIKILNAVVGTDRVPMNLRIENAIVSYIMYIWKMLWPVNLTFYYPFPKVIPPWQVLGSLLLLVLISFLAVKYMRKYPYFFVGWLWYLGTLVPVSGIMQGGLWPAIAERWAYIPLIGIFIIIGWGVSDLATRFRYKEIIISTAASILFIILLTLTRVQAGYWHDDRSLCEHGLTIDPNNYIAHNNLGIAYKALGKTDEALYHYKQTLQIEPYNTDAINNLANILLEQGKLEEALKYYKDALKIKPNDADTHNNIGNALEKMGKYEEAANHYHEALKSDPFLTQAHGNLGNVYLAQGKIEEAIKEYNTVLETNPNSSIILYNLGNAFARLNKMDEAILHYKDAIRVDPKYVDAYNNLGNALASKGNYDDAIKQYTEALKIKPDFKDSLNNLRIVQDMKNKANKPK